jgi:hypothetical protein
MSPDLIGTARRIRMRHDNARRSGVAVKSLITTLALEVAYDTADLGDAALDYAEAISRSEADPPWERVLHKAIDVALSALVLGEKLAPDRFGSIVAERLAVLEARAAQAASATATNASGP